MIVKNPTYVKVEVPAPSKFTQFMNGTLTTVTEEDLAGATELRAKLFENLKNLVKVKVPDSVLSYGEGIFNVCDNLVSVKLSKNAQHITDIMFAYCTSLINVEFPEGVVSTGYQTFIGCSKLENISIPTTFTTFGARTFYRTEYNHKNIYIKNIDSFSKINCVNDNTMTVISLTSYSLFLNNSLVENLDTSAEYIGQQIFYASELKSANLNNVAYIGVSSFANSKLLASVIIGDDITAIKPSAFLNCIKLTEITINKICTVADDVPILESTNAIPSTAYIYVPDTATQNLYKSATNWSTIASRILVKEA